MTTETRPINIKDIVIPEVVKPARRLLFDPRERIGEKEHDYIRGYLDRLVLGATSLVSNKVGEQLESAVFVFPDILSELTQKYAEKLQEMWKAAPVFYVLGQELMHPPNRHFMESTLRQFSVVRSNDHRYFLDHAEKVALLFPDTEGRIDMPPDMEAAIDNYLHSHLTKPIDRPTDFTVVAAQVKIAFPEYFEEIRSLVEGKEDRIQRHFKRLHEGIHAGWNDFGEKDHMYKFLQLTQYILTLHADDIRLTEHGFEVAVQKLSPAFRSTPLPITRQF